ncbi:MAG TPA: rhomboid family intramembrane serine protease [Thermoclostridium sp.]|nr:rhomboid family intramembrane serine protease [Thermoclostridium sp.]
MLKRIHYNSPVILTYTFTSLIALVLGYITNMVSTRLLFSVYKGSLGDIFFYVRLFGHVLGHANWEHFANNFLIILLVGPMLEVKYGSKSMIGMIAITAFVTGVLNVVSSNAVLLGASGIAFMLIILSSFVNIKKGSIPLTFVIVAALYIGKEIATGLLTNDNISQFTHIAGGVCGGVFGFTVKSNKC